MRYNVKPTGPVADAATAARLAHRWLRANLGQTAFVASVDREGEEWRIAVGAQVPKLIYDTKTGEARRPVFYEFNEVGRLRLSGLTGEVIDRLWAVDFRTNVNAELETVHQSVERALAKAGAKELSRIPFGEHMHTPMKNILSWLLYEPVWTVEDFENEPEVGVKWKDVVGRLESVQLVAQDGDIVRPGHAYNDILLRGGRDEEKVRAAMALYFAQADLTAVKQVIGPHLTLSRIIFEDSVEAEQRVPISYATVKARMMESSYGRAKERMIPRYLVQLAEVGMVESSSEAGDGVFEPQVDLLRTVLRQESLLSPLRDRLVRTT